MIGLALGLVLFHSRFGFTSAWRQLVAVGQGKALRAHMLMLAVACTLFAPVLAGGVTLAGPAAPSLAPVGYQPVRRLVPVRRRDAARRLLRLRHAVRHRQRPDRHPDHPGRLRRRVGRSAPTTSPSWTRTCPAHARLARRHRFGYLGAWVDLPGGDGRDRRPRRTLSPAVAARRPSSSLRPPRGAARAVRGSWPLWVGALLLAGLNLVTLSISGGAWGVTFAFSLWGSKILDAARRRRAVVAVLERPGQRREVRRRRARREDLGDGPRHHRRRAGRVGRRRRVRRAPPIPGRLALGAVSAAC